MIHQVIRTLRSRPQPGPGKRNGYGTAKHRRTGRPGFVTFTAVTLIALVAVALATIAAGMAADMRRTHEVIRETQLRQLLLAGGADATSRSVGWAAAPPAQSWELTLPESPELEGAHVTLTPNTELPATREAHGSIGIRIDASLPAGRSSETLRFTQTTAGWKLDGALLEGH